METPDGEARGGNWSIGQLGNWERKGGSGQPAAELGPEGGARGLGVNGQLDEWEIGEGRAAAISSQLNRWRLGNGLITVR
jgi:hypothetical protein